MVAPPAITTGFSVPKLITLFRTPLASKSPDDEAFTDFWSASSYDKALAIPVLRNEDARTRLPGKLLDKHCCKVGGLVLKTAELENLSGKVVGSDESFLGSIFLSQRTDKGVKLAALRASMA